MAMGARLTALAIAMFATRKIDWYALGARFAESDKGESTQ
jgi:inner membrane protein involved in colicin E2 resistance